MRGALVFLAACSFHGPPVQGTPGGDGGHDATSIDGAVDAQPDAPLFDGAPICAGSGFLRVCAATTPIDNLAISTAETIDTRSSPRCSAEVLVTSTVPVCVVAAMHVMISGNVRGIGDKPLVIVGYSSITISNRLDVSSTRAEPGANADPIGGCQAGSATTSLQGGGGGSFGGRGGAGGGATGAGLGGTAGEPISPIIALRGGCHGVDGFTPMGGGGGPGGPGGGAVALLAGGSITNSGVIDASGAGGAGGGIAYGNGGGGGAGGMILFDSPQLFNMNAVFANGGGGGEGADLALAGAAGGEAMSPVSNTYGGGGTTFAGNGGRGSYGGIVVGDPGDNGGGVPGQSGSGGGGGGAGVIKLFNTGTLTGNYAPPPI